MLDDATSAPPVTAATRPLRVGILVDDLRLPAWVESVLREIADSGIATLALVVVNAAATGEAGGPSPGAAHSSPLHRAARWWRVRDRLAYAAYQRLDRRRYLRDGDPTLVRDLAPLVAGTPVVRVRPRMTKHCDWFDDAAVSEIASHELDVVLRLGFRILKGDALKLARFGVWSFHHGDSSRNRGGPPGFWEVMRNEPVTGAVLQLLTEELDAGVVLARSHSSTNVISVAENRRNYYWQAAPLVMATLRDVHARRDAVIDDARSGSDWAAYSEPLFVEPRGLEMIGLALRLGARLAARKLRALLFHEQWFLAYRATRPTSPDDNVPDGSPHRFRELVPPNDRFWADPMPVMTDAGRRFVFFEEFMRGAPHAHICVGEIDEGGVMGAARRVLERPYHLSYPFVFTWAGEWYMIPETADEGRVELYRATRFPDEWALDRTLLSGLTAVDATVAEIDGRWWMFVGVAVPGTAEASLLHVYHSATPLGPWLPHARNPVKVDVRSARPAGPLFRRDGRWYRPAQCGAPAYGTSIVVHRLTTLTATAFEEVEVSRLLPTWRPGLTGTHTIAAAGGVTFIDARRRRRRF